MASSSSIVNILLRYQQQEELSEEDLTELRLWLMKSPKNEELFDELSNKKKWDEGIAKWKNKDPGPTRDKILKRIESISPEAFSKKRDLGRYLLAASFVLIVMSSIFYVWFIKKPTNVTDVIAQKTKNKEIQRARGSAVLTVSDGKIISLDSVSPGTVGKQENAQLTKTDSQALAYKTTTVNLGEEKFNTLTTSKGNQYLVVLSDGTKVWLNAASSLRFPVVFSGNTRNVELIGEAYFEVAKNKLNPFIVHTSQEVSVKVLGTHFNIKAYTNDQSVQVVLQEGSIFVKNTSDSTVLKPGEESTLIRNMLYVKPADIEKSMAWRSKLFWFKKDSFQEIMSELSRWYDIDVEYKGTIAQTYTGILPQNLPLSSVLKDLEKGGNVHFTIEEGNKVSVRP